MTTRNILIVVIVLVVIALVVMNLPSAEKCAKWCEKDGVVRCCGWIEDFGKGKKINIGSGLLSL